MTGCIDLEIGLRRHGDQYEVELRCSTPDSQADVRSGYSLVQFDLAELLERSIDDAGYGTYLTEKLFSEPSGEQTRSRPTTDQPPQAVFAQARGIAQAEEVPLRLRLFIGSSAPELHTLHWEKLRDPQYGSPLLTSGDILVSRYLSSLDWSPVRLRRKGDLRALVVVANPDLSDYPGLPQVDVKSELDRAQSSLADISVTALASDGTPTLAPRGTATMGAIMAHLRESYDILYLVCHGTLDKDAPVLWLEDESGEVMRVSGNSFVTRLRELTTLPRLVVLASCQSAGRGNGARMRDGGALAALGPRLAEAGVPAVLAMQGNITMPTIAEFMPLFFRELLRDGQVDRAVAVARGAVRERHDWWMPVLFMRLKTGRIWYTPGFGDAPQDQRKWQALLTSIRQGRCTPILGPDLADPLFGSRQEIARRLAETHRFPMAAHSREDLPQVTQYLAVDQDPNFLLTALPRNLYDELQLRFDLPEELTGVAIEKLPPDELMGFLDQLMCAAVTEQRRQPGHVEPYQVLAELDLPIYITTNPNNLLAEALAAAGKSPQVVICRWYEGAERLPDIYDHDPGYRPSKQEPLVFHLYGHISDLDSLVITEDNYFDYLIGVTKNNDLIPDDVRHGLVNTALLFLGFRLDDWNFRILFRSIMSGEGRRRRRRFANVAAQILPDEDRIEEPERVRRYLDEYFEGANISIYWGSVDDFVRDLSEEL
jgi:hypothetical protein